MRKIDLKGPERSKGRASWLLCANISVLFVSHLQNETRRMLSVFLTLASRSSRFSGVALLRSSIAYPTTVQTAQGLARSRACEATAARPRHCKSLNTLFRSAHTLLHGDGVAPVDIDPFLISAATPD